MNEYRGYISKEYWGYIFGDLEGKFKWFSSFIRFILFCTGSQGPFLNQGD